MSDDHNSQSTKFPSQTQNQTQNSLFTQTQPLSQGMDQYQSQMSGTSKSQKTQYEELQDQAMRAEKVIKKLHQKISTVHANRAMLEKYVEAEDKAMNELIEKQNISGIRHSLVQEQTTALQGNLIDFQEKGRKLKEFYDEVILKQDEKIKELKKQLDNQNLAEEKELVEELRSTRERVAQTRIRCQQSKNQANTLRKTVNEINGELEELNRMIVQNQRRHEEEMKKLSEIGKDIDEKLEIELGEISKLRTRDNGNSTKFEKLSTEYRALQVKCEERKKQMESSKSNIQELREKKANLNSELEELKVKHLAIISEKDLELADNRKQLQDFSAEYTETMNKLSEINSNNEKPSDTVAKTLQHNEGLKKDLLNKDEEITKLGKILNNAMEKNKELTTEKQRVSEELIAQREELRQTEADLETCDATQDKNSNKESELRTRLAIAKQELQNKIDEKSKLRTAISDAKFRSNKEADELKWAIELKKKELIETRKIKENLRMEEERVTSENERKLQELTRLSMQCQRAGHEKLMKEQNIKIELLRNQIQAEKLEHKQEIVMQNETSRKEDEKWETQVNEMKTKIENREKAISETRELVDGLRKILEKARTSEETASANVQESLNSSELLGILNTRAQAIPISSTPEHSPLRSRRISFDFGSSSDLSLIDGLDTFEHAKRTYAAFLQSETDTAKLEQQDKRPKS